MRVVWYRLRLGRLYLAVDDHVVPPGYGWRHVAGRLWWWGGLR